MAGLAKSFDFGPFHLDLAQKVLFRSGRPVPLPPKAFMILAILVENHGKIVDREELMQRVWPGVFVEEGNLNVNIFALRKVLTIGPTESPIIETVPRRGYRFVAPVQEVTEAEVRAPMDAAKPLPGGKSVSQPTVQGEIHGVRTRSVPAWAYGAVLLVLAAGFLGWEILAQPGPPRVLRVVQLTHIGLATTAMTDGARIFIAEQKGAVASIAQVPLEGGDPVPIATPFRNARLLDVSTSHSQLLVGSFDSQGDPKQMWILPLTGGSPRRLGNLTAESARWSPNGAEIAFEGYDGSLYVADAEGSSVRKILDEGGGVDSWSPDGRMICFTRTNQARGGMSLWEVQSDGTNLQPILPERRSPTARWGEGQGRGSWTPDGKYFIFREGFYSHNVGIWAMREGRGFWPFHRSEPAEIYAAAFDVDSVVSDPSGRRLYLVGHSETRELVRYDQRLKQFVPFLPALPGTPIWSPDQKWIAYVSADASLWKARPDGSDRLQLTFPPEQAFGTGWSPDGKKIVFHGLSPGQPGKIKFVPAEGGEIQTLFAGEPTGENCAQWSRDGNTLLFERTWLDKSGNTTRSALFTMDLKTNRQTELPGSEDMACPAWSPDGQSVVAHGDDSHNLSLFDLRSQKWKVIARGGYLNGQSWEREGKSVIFQDAAHGEDQPVYRLFVANGKMEEVASRKQFLRADVGRYTFTGLDPQDNPLAIVIHRNGDVYALDLAPK